MNETINKEPAAEFSAGYLRWLYSLTIVILILLFFVRPKLTRSFHDEGTIFMPAHVIAAGEIVKYGIDEFNKTEIEPIESGRRTAALVSMLVYFIIAPTVVLFMIRRSSVERRSEEKPIGITKVLGILTSLLGLLMVAIIFILTLAGAFQSQIIFGTMKYDNAISEERDMLTLDLVDAYSTIVQYYYQTEKYGGLNKNIIQKKSGGHGIVSLHEFGVKEKTLFGTLVLGPMSSDTLITVYAIGNSRLRNSSFKNTNNEVGKIQYSMLILPATLSHAIQKNN